MGQASVLEDRQLALGAGITLQPEWIVPSCCTQLLSPALTCSVLGSLKRADGGALVVPEVGLDLCPEKDMPVSHGLPRKTGQVLLHSCSPLCAFGRLFVCKWHRWPECLLKGCRKVGQGKRVRLG